ncbi:MAG: rhodanese-like domain-containing protein [Pikeienuella sp.]
MPAPEPRVDAVTPDHAFALLGDTPGAALVDVRTKAEWTFVGVPDVRALDRPMWFVEWASFPGMLPNPSFVPRLFELMDETPPPRLFFICRSGGRSMHAADAMATALAQRGLPAHCTNVAEGFEGDLDASGHRGGLSGWKMRGLPWIQT